MRKSLEFQAPQSDPSADVFLPDYKHPDVPKTQEVPVVESVIPKEWDIKAEYPGLQEEYAKRNRYPQGVDHPKKEEKPTKPEVSDEDKPEPVPYPEGLRDEDRPENFFDDAHVRKSWASKRKKFAANYNVDQQRQADEDAARFEAKAIKTEVMEANLDHISKEEQKRAEKEAVKARRTEEKRVKEAEAAAKEAERAVREQAERIAAEKEAEDRAKEDLAKKEAEAKARAAKDAARIKEKLNAETASAADEKEKPEEAPVLAPEPTAKEEAKTSNRKTRATLHTTPEEAKHFTETMSEFRKPTRKAPESEANEAVEYATEEDSRHAEGKTRIIRRRDISKPSDERRTLTRNSEDAKPIIINAETKISNRKPLADGDGRREAAKPETAPSPAPAESAKAEGVVETPVAKAAETPPESPVETTATPAAEAPVATKPTESGPSKATREYAASVYEKPSLARRALSALTSPFRAVGRAVDKVNAWFDFRENLLDANRLTNDENSAITKHANKLDKEKIKFETAKGWVANIQEAIKQIDEEKARNADLITPKISAKMDRDRRGLEAKLAKAQDVHDEHLQKVLHREGIVVNHENKRSAIAAEYAKIVDERMRPNVEERDRLMSVKRKYQEEIGAWEGRVSTYEKSIKEFEERAKANPYLKSVFKGKIKEAKRMLSTSKIEVESRSSAITGPQGFDEKLLDISNTLQKWDNKKKSYDRVANLKIKRTNDGFIPGPDTSKGGRYRDPIKPSSGSGTESASGSEGGSAEEGSSRAEAIESAPKEFGYDAWVKEWNTLHGSRIPINADTMFDADTVKRYRADGFKPLTDVRFAGLVKEHIKRLADVGAAKPKISDRGINLMTEAAFDSLRKKSVEGK